MYDQQISASKAAHPFDDPAADIRLRTSDGIDFYTQNKTTTALWKAEDAIGNKASVDMPTHH